MNFNLQINFFLSRIVPSDCLEQSTIKFKKNVDTFHYLDVKGKNPSKNHFTDQYQAVLSKLRKGYVSKLNQDQ